MRIKVSMRYLIKLFNLENYGVRVIFSEILSSDCVNELENRFENLEELAEASDKELLAIPGIGEKRVKEIRETLTNFFKKYIERDFVTGMPEEVPPTKRVKCSILMEDAQLYSCTIEQLNEAIKQLSKKERKLLKMSYGLNKKSKIYTATEISKKLEIPVSELDEYKIKVLDHLCNIVG